MMWLQLSFTFIQPHHILLITNNGQMSLQHTIAHILWVNNGSPTEIVVVIDAMVGASKVDICQAITKYEFLGIFFDFDIPMSFRSSDVLHVVAFLANPGVEPFVTAANKILTYLVANPNMYSRCCANAPFMPMLLTLNALHRHQNVGHNFFTNKVFEPGTQQNRLLAIAGSNVEAFETFIGERNIGHDGLHLLTDDCMKIMTEVMVGVRPSYMPDVFMYAGQKYRCEDTNNRPSLFTILKPGNGITDRYPPDTIGTAAIYNLMGLAVMFYEQVRFIISLLAYSVDKPGWSCTT